VAHNTTTAPSTVSESGVGQLGSPIVTGTGTSIPKRLNPMTSAPSSFVQATTITHDYEALDEDSPLYANLLAGAFAGIMV